MEKKKWTEQDNLTLIELHETSKYYKELYKRVGYFYRSLYKILGVVCIVSSSVSTSIFWIDTSQNKIICDNIQNNSGDINEYSDNEMLLKTLMMIMSISTILQNIVNFIDISNDYLKTSISYRKIQFKIESIGDIHPSRRKGTPKKALPNLRDSTNKLSQDSNDINAILTWLFHNRNKVQSYMGEKHKNYEKEEISDDEYSGDYNYNDNMDDTDITYERNNIWS